MDKTYSAILKIISRYLDTKQTQVFVFGSRAVGKNRPFSDVDIGFVSKIPVTSETYFSIIEDLDESDIPYHVDLVDFSKVDDKFKQVALQKIIKLN